MTRADPDRGHAPTTVRVVLPAPLRELTGGRAALHLGGRPATVREALSELKRVHPAVHDRLVTEQGELREHVNVFVGKENVRRSRGLDTPLGEEDEILVLPAVSGG